jgi:putative aldouronate transport system permease protein
MSKLFTNKKETQLPEQHISNKYKGGMVGKASTVGYLADIAIILIMIISVFCFIIPIWHVVMASISNGKLLAAHDGLVLIPVGEMTLNGYKLIFSDANVLKGYMNTLIFVVGATMFGLVLNIIAGYVASRDTMLSKPFTIIILFTMIFNGGLIPTYMVIRALGWVGTRWALLIPGCTHAVYMMIMITAFRTVPEETVEAARIDGAGHIRTMVRIMLPQCTSMVTVVVLFSVVQQWNSWFPASIYLSTKRDLWPLQLWIKQIVAQNADFLTSTAPDYNRILIQYAVIVAATIPILCAFPFFQNHIEKGVLIGGVKG